MVIAGTGGGGRHGGSSWVLNSNQILFLPSLHMHMFFITKAQSNFRHTKDAHQNMCQEQYSMGKKNGPVN